MQNSRIVRYSKYIRPISIFSDILIIVLFVHLLFKELNINCFAYSLYLVIGWSIAAFFVKFYQVYRFTTPVEIFSKIAQQEVIFSMLVIVYFPFSNGAIFDKATILFFIILNILSVSLSKYIFYYLLIEYRIITGSNYRNVIIIGYTPEAISLKEFFETRTEYAYHFLGFFSENEENIEIKGKYEDAKKFVLENKINEVYCSLNDLSKEKLNDLVDFMDGLNVSLKFIPDNKDIISKNLKIDYYELFPVLSLKNSVLNEPEIAFIKRIFDIFLASIIIIFVLSWVVPILGLLIKLESKGPVFFKQGRPGINQKEFQCYKFRSMVMNKTSENETVKNDPRITKIGQFMRKTSIDELPQFFNVLIGDMSIVGPRPQLWIHNNEYQNKIKKYFVRHSVKPGITGLAQVSGYRGEINSDLDMENRIKFDVFYIENWSIFLDIKIIFQTIISIFKGDEKAY